MGTQTPHRIKAAISRLSTELVCFRLDERLALQSIRDLRADPEAVQALPLGQFIAYKRLSCGNLAGKVF